jgi:hypothetical protein
MDRCNDHHGFLFQLMVVLAAETALLPVITRREFGSNTPFALSATAFSIEALFLPCFA